MRSTRRRVTRLTIAILLVMSVGYAGFFYSLAHGILLHEIDEGLERMATPLTEAMYRPMLDFRELKRAVAAYPLWPDDYVAVLDRHGNRLAERGDRTRLPSPLPTGASELAGEPARLVVTPITVTGQLRGTLIQIRSLEDVRHTLGHVALGLLALIPLALMLSLALAIWLAEKTARPVEQALVRERQFSRDASHELRTPLALILTNTQLLLKRTGLDADMREKLELIEERARRMKALIQNLLTLGREDAGLGEAPMRFSLCELLESEVDAIAQRVSEGEIHLEVADLPPDAQILGSPNLVGQVIQNLLDNALHYTPTGGTVRVGLRLAGPRAHLTVTNSGPGIPEPDQARIFERFVRLDHGRGSNPEGNGLGLAIARAIARAHRGDLMLHSRPDEGTTFTLALPLA